MRPVPSAYSRALDALSRRSRSAADLSRWLRNRKYEPDDIAEVVERLNGSGLLDDQKYAQAFARSRLLDRKLSRRRVLAELGRSGVARETALAAVDAVIEDEGVDEVASVESVAARKLRTMTSLDRNVARRRLMAFLARRGYDLDMVRSVVRKLT